MKVKTNLFTVAVRTGFRVLFLHVGWNSFINPVAGVDDITWMQALGGILLIGVVVDSVRSVAHPRLYGLRDPE